MNMKKYNPDLIGITKRCKKLLNIHFYYLFCPYRSYNIFQFAINLL